MKKIEIVFAKTTAANFLLYLSKPCIVAASLGLRKLCDALQATGRSAPHKRLTVAYCWSRLVLSTALDVIDGDAAEEATLRGVQLPQVAEH